MLAAFVEAAVRSLILAIVVWAGLQLFRIHNVSSQRSAWMAVLVGSLLMPLALPMMAHWPRLPFATIPAPASLNHLQSALAPAPPTALSATGQLPDRAADGASERVRATAALNAISTLEATASKTDQTAARSILLSAGRAAAMSAARQTASVAAKTSFLGFAVLAYFLVAAGLLVRLLFGLASAMYLWHTSIPIPPVSDVPFGADLNLRSSHRISAPVTIGSGIVLPANYKGWTREKTRIVLAHERSHVNQHDFHLQILASLYAALVWFSPLGWWLKR